MLLTVQQSYELLAKHGCYVTEACDKCGQVLGPVRYTRKNESGVWCSRECRGSSEQETKRNGGRPPKYRTQAARENAGRAQNAERQKRFRARVQRNGKPPRIFSKTKDLQAQKSPLSHYPLTRPSVAQESSLCEFGGVSL